MSKNKFYFLTIITKENTFFEFETLEEYQNEGYGNDVLGYFPSESNVTYDELDDYENNEDWIVTYVEKEQGHHLIETFNSTMELKMSLDKLIKKSYENEYINVYNQKDFIYV